MAVNVWRAGNARGRKGQGKGPASGGFADDDEAESVADAELEHGSAEAEGGGAPAEGTGDSLHDGEGGRSAAHGGHDHGRGLGEWKHESSQSKSQRSSWSQVSGGNSGRDSEDQWWNYDWTWSWSGGWAKVDSQPRRDSYMAKVEETTRGIDGRWPNSGQGSHRGDQDEVWSSAGTAKPTEKMMVPEFSGEGVETELGLTARSYLRKVKAWLKCTKLHEKERALALYTHLSGKAWVCAEELDVDLLGTPGGVEYYLDWVRVRFMEMEVNKVSNVMSELFRRCKKKGDQTVRDFNVEFERLLLHLAELDCELPPLVKAWLYLDRLRLHEAEELAILASVGNKYDLKMLQQAAIIQDRGARKVGSWEDSRGKGNGGRWHGRHTVHFTEAGYDGGEMSEEDEVEVKEESDSELVTEEVAMTYHDAYMAYQDAKSRYREAVKGRGVDRDELKRRSEERLKAAKLRSYCGACKRKGHWHKDPECPLRSSGGSAPTTTSSSTVKSTQMASNLQHVQMCYMTDFKDASVETFDKGSQQEMLAIADTACTKAVAGHAWFEAYYKMADELGIKVEIQEETSNSEPLGSISRRSQCGLFLECRRSWLKSRWQLWIARCRCC